LRRDVDVFGLEREREIEERTTAAVELELGVDARRRLAEHAEVEPRELFDGFAKGIASQEEVLGRDRKLAVLLGLGETRRQSVCELGSVTLDLRRVVDDDERIAREVVERGRRERLDERRQILPSRKALAALGRGELLPQLGAEQRVGPPLRGCVGPRHQRLTA